MRELKRRGFGEFLLWHIFGLVPYWIRTKNKEIIFYASMKNSIELNRLCIKLQEINNAQSN